MKRLLPATLFGRLVLVLLGGLLLAQLLGAGILLHDRGVALHEANRLHAAQRIVAAVHLLDSLDPTAREHAVAALDAPPMRITLIGEARAPAEPAETEQDDHAADVLGAILREQFGDDRPVRVILARNMLPPRLASDDHHARYRHAGPAAGSDNRIPRGLTFVVQVRLGDGVWVRFDHHLPDELFALPWRLLLMLFVLLVSVIALSLIVVRVVTRPLSVLATAAVDLGKNIQHPPLAETGPAEVRRAARAFNTMQERLSRYLRDREHMLAAVSHDLRTPITRLRLRAEMLEDTELRTKVLRDLDDMQTMVSGALDFLRDTRGGEAVQPTDIMALLESLQADFEDMGQTLQLSGAALAPYPARPVALKRCLTNLIENAIRHGRLVGVRVEDDAEALRIAVTDEGPGIPEDQLQQVFEPFYRLEVSRSRGTGGTGLGLSIARNIARAHGGDLMLRNRPAGGLEAVLTLPR